MSGVRLPLDLQVPEAEIRAFLERVKTRLSASRVRVAYGSNESEHFFYAGARDDEVAETQHVVVIVAVQRVQGRSRVVFRGVRRPDEREWTELGAVPQPAWSSGLSDRVTECFTREVTAAKAAGAEPAPVFRRFQLSYDAIRGLDSEHWVGPWRLGPPIAPPDGTMSGEKIILCDRLLSGADPFPAFGEVDRLANVLTVFWLHRFQRAENAEHVWVYDDLEPGGNLTSRLAQRGYADNSRTPVMPAPGALGPAGTYREVDRLDEHAGSIVAGDPFRPPSDSPLLFERFYGADVDVADRFLAACKTYETAMRLATSNPTGAISYLVVTAESLLEGKLERCECCDQVMGISRATRELFFELLPCLEQQREEIERFLKRVYAIRSAHFHDADFVAGELEPDHQTQYLMPARMEAWTTLRRLMALVNSLLVAWLLRRTGEPWARATQDPPKIREPKYFSVSATLGGGVQPG